MLIVYKINLHLKTNVRYSVVSRKLLSLEKWVLVPPSLREDFQDRMMVYPVRVGQIKIGRVFQREGSL